MSGNPSDSDDDQSRRRGDQPPTQRDQRRQQPSDQRQQPRQSGGRRRQQSQGQPRQSQGQQPQQPQGQQRQQSQGQQRQQPQYQRRRPPAGGGSTLGGIDGGSMTGIIATMSIAGVLMGIMSALLSLVGGFPSLPGSVTQTRSALQDLSANSGGLQQSGQSELGALNQAISTAHEAVVTGLTTELAPFVAFVIAVAIGVGLAVKSTDDSPVATAGVGSLIGGFLFILLAVFITSIFYPSVPTGESATTITGTFSGLANQNGTILKLQLTNLLLNSVVVGIVTGLTAAASAFSVDRFFD